MQDDDLDVLAADVDDHVGIFVEFQRRFGVRDGLDQGHVSLENIFQNVFGIAGGGDPENFEFRVLVFHLGPQALEHFDRVLDRIAVRELVGLAENRAVFVEQYRLGGS